MDTFLYTAWFRDPHAKETNQDYEWPACFIIEAKTYEDAHSWEDFLSLIRETRLPSAVFLTSYIEKSDQSEVIDLNVPFVTYGERVSDDKIGW